MSKTPDNTQVTSMLNLIKQIRSSLGLPELKFDASLNSYLNDKIFSSIASEMRLEFFKKYPLIHLAGCNKIFSSTFYSYHQIQKGFFYDDTLRSIILSPGNKIYLETGTITKGDTRIYYIKICVALDISMSK